MSATKNIREENSLNGTAMAALRAVGCQVAEFLDVVRKHCRDSGGKYS